MKFRKKPIVIEATQWFSPERASKALQPDSLGVYWQPSRGKYIIDTLEGTHEVSDGDWIVTGIKGEHYPVKPDIFEKTYEKV